MNFKEILTNIARAIVDEPDAVNVEEYARIVRDKAGMDMLVLFLLLLQN